MSEYSKEEAKGLNKNLDLIERYGTEEDKKRLRGSGLPQPGGSKSLSKTFYRRIREAKKRGEL